MSELTTNQKPGFHILICLIEIWTPQNKKDPNGPDNGDKKYICEVEEVEIEESFKKLISTASVRFPRGTVVRQTITATEEDAALFKSVTANVANNGVVETTRTTTSVMTNETFKVGQRIKIYLGYTTDPAIAELAKTGGTGKTIYNDTDKYNEYLHAFEKPEDNSNPSTIKQYLGLLFDGYITKISVDTPIELECENLASALKEVTCPPKVTLKHCEVKDLLGEDGTYKLLEGTGLKLHSETAKQNFDLGGVTLPEDLTVADVLINWAKYGLFCYVSDDNGQPAIQIGKVYFTDPGEDSLLRQTPRSQPIDIYFDYHVARNNLSLTSSDKNFLAVQAKGVNTKDNFITITIIKNPDYDDSKEDSESNPKYRYVNEAELSKKAIKAGRRYLTETRKERIDLKKYTQVAYLSKTIPITVEQLAEEAVKYFELYNMTGIEGSITLFGDLCLRTGQQVNLIDRRYPGKEGRYLVEEVNTTFGTDGFRQKITLPYCISRKNQMKDQTNGSSD